MTNPLLEAALQYAEIGFSVIPIKPKDKAPPLIDWIEYQEKKASKDEIKAWWESNPNANIGVVTGKISGICVVDHDCYNSKYSEKLALQYFPDSILTPCSSTPKGGVHMVFEAPDFEIVGKAEMGGLPAIDFRCDKNYIVVPPSVGNNGKLYTWTIDLRGNMPMRLPDAYINKILSTIYRGVTGDNGNELHSVTINFEKGHRDDSLFHIGHTMIKGGASKLDTEIVLNLLAKQCKPPFPTNEISVKIKSILDRTQRKERNLMRELECYIDVTTGWFDVTSCYTALHCVTKEDKTAIRVGLSRLKGKVIEKHGDKDGVYKKILHELEFIKFSEPCLEEESFPVILPLGLNDLVEISPGNIIVVAGEYNAGKTGFLINVLAVNKNRKPIRYLSSETKKGAFIKRFRGFPYPPTFWHEDEMTDYAMRSHDFHTVLKPDGINIIDYLEFRDADFTRGGEYILKIWEGLKSGIALVAIQKRENTRLPRSGDLVLEKPTLAIAFSKIAGQENLGRCEILKAKEGKIGKCDGKKCEFEIIDWGSRFKITREWGYWRS